ncbi:MAG: PIN domain-containing protein [Candidatus Micrarchaeaceae archaeon]
MILVVDANSVISALLKDSKARQIIVSDRFTLVAPEFLGEELYKHRKYIAEKSGISDAEVKLLVTLLLRHIRIVPKAEYKAKLGEASAIMENDVGDAPYVACYLALQCDGIWTNDADYDNKVGIKIVSTSYLLKLL